MKKYREVELNTDANLEQEPGLEDELDLDIEMQEAEAVPEEAEVEETEAEEMVQDTEE